MTGRELTLYSTEGCHLCEAAEALLGQVRAAQGDLQWQVVDIALDDVLFERYGWSIPVLRDRSGRELNWPFDGAQLREFLSAG
ncbi:MAG: glutaredoxin family protein [Halieaceae bacterium]|jgi:hypothetical protein|nr:glutaredoxin family protein [Halieaceae bacterium]